MFWEIPIRNPLSWCGTEGASFPKGKCSFRTSLFVLAYHCLSSFGFDRTLKRSALISASTYMRQSPAHQVISYVVLINGKAYNISKKERGASEFIVLIHLGVMLVLIGLLWEGECNICFSYSHCALTHQFVTYLAIYGKS